MTADDNSSPLPPEDVVEYFSTDDDAIFQLQHVVYPDHPLYSDKDRYLKFWRWWFWEQPWRKGRVFGVRGDGCIAGLRPLSFLPVQVSGRKELCGFLNATVTHPDYRRRGIFSRTLDHVLDRAAREEGLRFAISFPNDNSYPLHLRNDRIVALGDLPFFVALLNPRNVFRTEVRFNLAAKLCLLFASGSRARAVPEYARLTALQCFDARFDALWERVKNSNAIWIERTSEYLNWRYTKSPYGPYTIIAAEHKDTSDIVGYVVATEVVRFGLRFGLIADIVIDPDYPSVASAIIRDMIDRSNEHGIDAAACLMFAHHPLARALRQNGFVNLPAALSPKRFHVTVSRLTGDETLNTFLAKRGNWYLTWGDTDNV